MSLYQTFDNRLRLFFRAVVALWLFFFAMTSAIMMVAMPSDSAHSMLRTADVVLDDMERSSVKTYSKKSSSSNVLAPDASDPCLSLINTRSAHSNKYKSAYATNASLPVLPVRAGNNSALGLVLGVHFALEAHHKNRRNVIQADSKMEARDLTNIESVPLSTRSISAYRQCKKELALQALNNRSK